MDWLLTSKVPRIFAVALIALVAIGWYSVGPDKCVTRAGCMSIGRLKVGNAFDAGHQLMDRSGEPMALVGGAKRTWTPLTDLPQEMVEGWIAVEDKRFHEHSGLDLQGIFRAVVANVKDQSVSEGASTIPMQLVRVLWEYELADMGRWERKLFEARMAPRLVSELGRSRVLELYLNGIYLGEGTYGVRAASTHFFGVPPAELTPGQIATLIGMTKTPERYKPRDNPDKAIERRSVVLDIMEREGILTAVAASEARQEPMETVEAPPFSYERDYITTAVVWELKRVAPELVGEQGLVIYTTVDPDEQDAAMRLVNQHIDAIEAGRYGRFLPGDERLQASGIAMDSRSGEILAMIGGRGFKETQLNRPFQSRRQIGSLAKPFILAAALRNGESAALPVSTATIELKGARGRTWSPRDHVSESSLLPRDIVVKSSNRGAVRLGMNVGMDRFKAVVRGLGIDEEVPEYPSSYLGSFDATLSQVTGAFAAFENGGYRIHPHLIRRIEDGSGRVVWERPPGHESVRVLSPTTAYLVLDAMKGVVTEGTGWTVGRDVAGPKAGKTGTSNDGKDVWFVGVRPGMAVGLWLGMDEPKAITSNGSGGGLVAPLWSRWVTGLARSGYGTGADWQAPPGVETVFVRTIETADGPQYCSSEAGGRGVLMRSNDALYLNPCSQLRQRMYDDSLSMRIGGSWPSDTTYTGYEPDRLRLDRTQFGDPQDSLGRRYDERRASERDDVYDSIRARLAEDRRDLDSSRGTDRIGEGSTRDSVRASTPAIGTSGVSSPARLDSIVIPHVPVRPVTAPRPPKLDTVKPDTVMANKPDTLPVNRDEVE